MKLVNFQLSIKSQFSNLQLKINCPAAAPPQRDPAICGTGSRKSRLRRIPPKAEMRGGVPLLSGKIEN
ncbi:MAG: hypothetical protein COV69_01580 [Parcubacteria group bacterium CG11_big_fil_rev_8_21_14_0_20_39_14]|nr:MAG: hypothetical protein COV69_01580 [Parcubacteria group bacterium CG11_big_fil_rev_8_21_14_0_20_39_14]PIS35291.1 MAG: hypothetical protein COT36_03160 [Parcubacteria group bacterium CG08_land_8_20_14_0_20_38_56]